MTRLHRLYTLGVLWLLSLVGKDAVEAIYRHGHDDGEQHVRDFMRRELQAVQVGAATDRMRSYHRGYRDALRFLDGDEPIADAPIERVM